MIDYIKEEGLVINKYDYGEADRYLTIFTRLRGKVVFFLKGIRKSKKRELSSTDVLNLSKFIYYSKSDKYKFHDSQSVETYMEIKEDFDNLNTALYILSILNNVLVENNPKEKLYDVTKKSLDFLQKNKDIRKNYLLIIYYLYYIIKDEGLRIEIGNGNIYSFLDLRFGEYENSCYKLKIAEKEILEKLVNGKIKELIKGNESVKDILKIIFLLEVTLNYQFDTNLNFKNYIMGVKEK